MNTYAETHICQHLLYKIQKKVILPDLIDTFGINQFVVLIYALVKGVYLYFKNLRIT